MDDALPLAARLELASWRWAKTYAQHAPHWYILGRDAPALVEEVRALIAEAGVDRAWRDGRTYRYLELAGWKYWYLPPVLNREPLSQPGSPPDA